MISRSILSRRSGFTLIELMIVVAILGILAAVAVPAFLSYIQDSKKAEAEEALKSIADGALAYYQEEHPDTTGFDVETQKYPTGYKCTEGGANVDGSKADPSDTDFNHSVWHELRFSLSKPHYFKYCYRSNSGRKGFSARADAALAGNGARDTRFCLTGTSQPQVSAAVELDISVSCASGNP